MPFGPQVAPPIWHVGIQRCVQVFKRRIGAKMVDWPGRHHKVKATHGLVACIGRAKHATTQIGAHQPVGNVVVEQGQIEHHILVVVAVPQLLLDRILVFGHAGHG